MGFDRQTGGDVDDPSVDSLTTDDANVTNELQFDGVRSDTSPETVINDTDTASSVDETITIQSSRGEFKEIRFIFSASTTASLLMRLAEESGTNYDYNEIGSGTVSNPSGQTEFTVCTLSGGGFITGEILLEQRDRGLGTNRPGVCVNAGGRGLSRMLDGVVTTNLGFHGTADVRLWSGGTNATLKAVVREGDK